MIQLFKVKSLKKTQETEQDASACGAKVSADVQGADNKNAKKQQGRSMVEMLGVLAIIGVLSIGGISGYTMAMRRYKANEIVAVMNKYAMVLYQSCQVKMHNDPVNFPHMNYCNPVMLGGINKGVDLLKFTDAGLGPLPTGVLLVADSQSPASSFSTFYFNPNEYISTSKSRDMVEISILLDNQMLCQTISDLTNEKNRDTYGSPYEKVYEIPCQKTTIDGKTGYPTHMVFYVS